MNESLVDPYTNSTQNSTGDNVYFYARSDIGIILNTLSPIRSKALKAVPILHHFGVLSNLIAIIILSQKSLLNKKSIFFLMLLAYSDMMYNAMALLGDVLRYLKIVDYDIFQQSNLSCFFFDSRILLFHFYSVSLTLFATFDRFVHIWKPLKFNQSLSGFKTRMKIGLLLFLVCVILALPHGFLFVYNESEKSCDAHPIFKQKFFNSSFTNYEIFFMFTEPLVIWFIPGFLILAMNGYVIYKIIKSSRIKSKTVGTKSNYASSHKNTTVSEKKDSVHQYTQSEVKTMLSPDGSHTDSSNHLNLNYCSLKEKSKSLLSININREKVNNMLSKISLNQLSHYITIIALGFYFIITTIPFSIMLALMNKLTLKLNYHLPDQESYLNDETWIKYGHYRDYVMLFKLFFISNHCLNFFFYLLFNRQFSSTLIGLLVNCKNRIVGFIAKLWPKKNVKNDYPLVRL